MKTDELITKIDTILKENHGVDEYRIEYIKISNKNYFINEVGELHSIDCLNVSVLPTKQKERITIKVTMNNNEHK